MSNELSNFDIINLIKDYKIDYCFGGIYSKDLLPKELKRTKFYIVNMQDHDKGNGTLDSLLLQPSTNFNIF